MLVTKTVHWHITEFNVYSLKQLGHIKQLTIKIKVKKVSFKMMLENGDVFNVADVCWQRFPV